MDHSPTTETPLLSVCMIVKNEALLLGRALDSLQHVADEVIVLDTGSTDETVSIATARGAKVFQAVWEDDFAKTRNISLSHANGRWILYFDADEVFDLLDPQSFLDMLRESSAAGLHIVKSDIYGEAEAERGYDLKLFRRHPAIYFTYPIHETVLPSIAALHWPSEKLANISESIAAIRHYGYEAERVLEKSKLERNLRILRKRVEADQNDLAGWYYFAHACADSGLHEDANKAYQRSEALIATIAKHKAKGIADDNFIATIVASYVLFLKDHQYFAEAITLGGRYTKVFPHAVNLFYALATAYHGVGGLNQAKALYLRCIGIGDRLSNFSNWRGVAGYLARYNLGELAIRERDWVAAEGYLTAVIGENPAHIPAYLALAEVFMSQGNVDKAIAQAELAFAKKPNDPATLQTLGLLYREQGNAEVAVRYFRAAMELQPTEALRLVLEELGGC